MNDRSLQSQANSAPVEGEISPVTGHHALAAPSVSAGSRGSPRIATFFASSGSASRAASIFQGGNRLDLTLGHPSVFCEESPAGMREQLAMGLRPTRAEVKIQ